MAFLTGYSDPKQELHLSLLYIKLWTFQFLVYTHFTILKVLIQQRKNLNARRYVGRMSEARWARIYAVIYQSVHGNGITSASAALPCARISTRAQAVHTTLQAHTTNVFFQHDDVIKTRSQVKWVYT